MNASFIVDNVLNNHFETTKKPVIVQFFDSGKFQYSSPYHTEHLAWAAGENWKMLGSTKSYEIKEP